MKYLEINHGTVIERELDVKCWCGRNVTLEAGHIVDHRKPILCDNCKRQQKIGNKNLKPMWQQAFRLNR